MCPSFPLQRQAGERGILIYQAVLRCGEGNGFPERGRRETGLRLASREGIFRNQEEVREVDEDKPAKVPSKKL